VRAPAVFASGAPNRRLNVSNLNEFEPSRVHYGA